MDLDLRPYRSQAVKWRVLDEEGVLVHLESGTYFSLNPVGLFVWDRCGGDLRIRDIAEGVVDEFEVEPEVALRDLHDFLDSLAEQQLIAFDDSPGEAAG